MSVPGKNVPRGIELLCCIVVNYGIVCSYISAENIKDLKTKASQSLY